MYLSGPGICLQPVLLNQSSQFYAIAPGPSVKLSVFEISHIAKRVLSLLLCSESTSLASLKIKSFLLHKPLIEQTCNSHWFLASFLFFLLLVNVNDTLLVVKQWNKWVFFFIVIPIWKYSNPYDGSHMSPTPRRRALIPLKYLSVLTYQPGKWLQSI